MSRQLLLLAISVLLAGCIPSPEGGPLSAINPDASGAPDDGATRDTGDAKDFTGDAGVGLTDDAGAGDVRRPPEDSGAQGEDTRAPLDMAFGPDAGGDLTVYVLRAGGSDGYGGIDTNLLRDTPNTNYSDEVMMTADDGESVLLWWDTRPIPQNATVVSARVELFSNGTSSGDFNVYEIVRTWRGMEATWTSAVAGVPWDEPGCSGPTDRGDVVLGVVGAGDGTLDGLVIETPELLQVVRNWVANSSSNQGITLQHANSNDGLDLHSSEAESETLRPALIVSFRAP